MKTATAFSARNDHSPSTFSKPNFPTSWRPSLSTIVPHRIRRKLRSKVASRQSPASSLASLQKSFSPSDTIRSLRAHRWSYFDGQYLILAILAIFSLCIAESPGPVVKTAAAALLMTALILPITRQFFLPILPILTWVFLFFSAR
jgi:hypothetical protein